MKERPPRLLGCLLFSCLPLLSLSCRYSSKPQNGTQACAATDKRCGDGYYCAADQRCWRNGTSPLAPGGTDGGPGVAKLPKDPSTQAAPGRPVSTAGLVAAGARGSTAAHRATLTLGDDAAVVQRSPKYRFVGSLVGSPVVGGQR